MPPQAPGRPEDSRFRHPERSVVTRHGSATVTRQQHNARNCLPPYALHDAAITQIYEGRNQIQRMVMTRQLLK